MSVSEVVHFVDANVPMYAVGAEHPLKEPCLAVLRAIARGDVVAVTDAEVHQEILHRYAAISDRRRAVEVSSLFLRVVPDVLSVTKADVEATALLLSSHPSLPVRGAVHAAVMARHAIGHVISADLHFDRMPELVRLDPTRWG